MLKTKSVQKPKTKTDGVRVCVMRRIKPEFEFDIWIPILAPSTKLLKNYHEGKISWKDFEKLFGKEVFKKQKKCLDFLGNFLEKQTITLLCWEETPEKCHRRLLAEEIKKLYPKTELQLT